MDGISGNERTIWYVFFSNRIQRKVYLRGDTSSFYVLLDADCIHYFHYVRKIGLITKIGIIKGNQGRVLSISVEQKYRVLHRRCGGVCVRDGCESNDGVVYARQKQSIRSQRRIPRKRADGGGRMSRPSSERESTRVVGGKRCLRLERRRHRRRNGAVIFAFFLTTIARRSAKILELFF